MIKKRTQYYVASIAGVLSCILLTTYLQCKSMKPYVEIKNVADAIALFPKSVPALQAMADRGIAAAEKEVAAIIAIPAEQRTFANTVRAFDHLIALSDFRIAMGVISITQMVHPEKAMRDAAQEAVMRMEAWMVDHISDNVELYQALKSYAYGNAMNEALSDDDRYFLQETLDAFKRGGLDLPEQERSVVKQLKKEIAELSNKFDANIAQDNRTITVDESELAGLEADFIAHLERAHNGDYLLGVDYPTYHNVMDNCTISATRQKLAQAFNNRAYPINEPLLKEIFAKRHELAQRLGFASYAELDLADQMVKNPERAQHFLDELIEKVRSKEQQEFDQLVADLPAGVELTSDGKMKSWDSAYVQAAYRKKHFALDEREIAQYFPMEKTIAGLLHVYEQFLGLSFEQVPVSGLWHEDVRCIQVSLARNNQLQGYLFLDLYPRANKYSHACFCDIVPAYYPVDGSVPPALGLVIANFPKSTGDKPSLLKRSDVNTFFHEFGHALHALLGRTHLASVAGTSVKRDFVELPSQMLEEWLDDAEILKLVSSHYQTGEPLPDEVIRTIIELKNFDSGTFVQRQAYLATMALQYHQNVSSDLQKLMKDLQTRIRVNIHSLVDDHMYASFGHLTGYGAKYYGYLWSKVFALDMFAQIKKEGLLNPHAGQKYIDRVIGRGGSKDPNALLIDFLGREPNQEAFLRDMGLE